MQWRLHFWLCCGGARSGLCRLSVCPALSIRLWAVLSVLCVVLSVRLWPVLSIRLWVVLPVRLSVCCLSACTRFGQLVPPS